MKSEQCNHLIDYFNGMMSKEEEAVFERHLEECGECREELAELRLLTEDLPYLSDPVEPSPDLKSRILEAAYEENGLNQEEVPELEAYRKNKPLNEPEVKKSKRSQALLIGGLAAGLVVSLAGNVIQLSDQKEEEQLVQSEAIEKKVALASTEGNQSLSAKASFVKEKDEQLMVLQADGLPEIKDGELYQVWLIKGEKPVPAGYFTPDKKGNGALVYKVSDEELDWDTVAITVENEPNLSAPQGKVVLAGTI
ncbi:anti-sigma factor [Bacillus sp. FJAT-42376]|uniref:anti-sigma factor n=1 Tax=Bacillus sp. FJAT-42376 TaxID=2014076 RepID=UPI000F4D2E2D|nr:anti-sigma factor [Bacillus sp. FJAT-42376]AZB44767.1 anti-sigma factor [Bacillus sp. FJAT-42376]